jgi:cytochrome c oxidase subunit IV
VRHHIRRYLIVGVALAIGTALTVWASLINFGSREINIVVALLIASAKGFLVAGFFMHLISEKKMIYAVLATSPLSFSPVCCFLRCGPWRTATSSKFDRYVAESVPYCIHRAVDPAGFFLRGWLLHEYASSRHTRRIGGGDRLSSGRRRADLVRQIRPAQTQTHQLPMKRIAMPSF